VEALVFLDKWNKLWYTMVDGKILLNLFSGAPGEEDTWLNL
jgi:hypothetical protein